LSLFWLAGLNLATFPLRMAQPLRASWTAIKSTVKTFAGEFLGQPHAFPMTRFNTEVSPHRVFETRRFALQDFKAIRALVPDASVNDVVLAVCAGGLRNYLAMQDELPEESLVAAAPIAVHSDLETRSAAPNFSVGAGGAGHRHCRPGAASGGHSGGQLLVHCHGPGHQRP